MAGGYGGQLVALDVEQPNLDLVSPLARVAALKQQQVQTEEAKQQLEQEPLRAEALRLANAAARQKNVAGQQANTLGQMQLRDALIGGAAARALDSDSWDQLMSEAVKNGAPEAAQFIGRYSPILAQRIAAAYGGGGAAGGASSAAGGAGGGAGASSGDQTFALMFEKQTPQQLQQSFDKYGNILRALGSVKDPQSYEQAVQWLTQNGVPEAQQFAGQYNPLAVQALYQRILPAYQYLQGRLASAAAGVPALPPAREVKESGGRLYSVDALGRNATQLTEPAARYTAIPGAMDASGRPWVLDSTTGKVTLAPDIYGGGGTMGASDIANFVDTKLIPSESAGVATAQNPNSTAGGLGQFTDATWRSVLMKHRPDLVEGKTDAQVLALKNDPTLNREMTVANAQDNAQALASARLPVTTLTVGLAHVLGPDGVKKFLGAAPNALMSAVVSPDAMKANPQFSRDVNGKQVPRTVAEVGQIYAQKWGNEPLAVQGLEGATSEAQLSGDDFLKTLAPRDASVVQAIADGRMDPPSSFAMAKNPYWQRIMQDVYRYDPTADSINIKARAATRKDFTSGKSAQNLTSINTALGHIGELDAAVNALGNIGGIWGAQQINAFKNALAGSAGSPALRSFNIARNAVASELTRVFRGTGGSVHDVQEWEKQIKDSDSPAALHAAVATALDLLDSRLEQMGQQYSQGMGKSIDPIQLLSPKSAAIYKQLKGMEPPVTTAAAPRMGAPTVGTVQGGYKFKGGDPADKANWIKVAA